MSQYRVQYALSNDPNATETSGFSSDTTMNNLEMIVEAIGQSQAQATVEMMFGGPLRVWIKSVVPIY